MKHQLLLTILLATLLALQQAKASSKVGGVTLEDNLSAGDNISLAYNGAGIRKKLFLKLYVGSLYLDNKLKGANAAAIIEADAPMLIQLNILSELLTRDKMIKALNDGFSKATGSNTAPIQNEITSMIDALDEPIRPGDTYQLQYTPSSGTSIIRRDETLVVIPGLPFKQALFGIWLSDTPVQGSLKGAMLGS